MPVLGTSPTTNGQSIPGNDPTRQINPESRQTVPTPEGTNSFSHF